MTAPTLKDINEAAKRHTELLGHEAPKRREVAVVAPQQTISIRGRTYMNAQDVPQTAYESANGSITFEVLATHPYQAATVNALGADTVQQMPGLCCASCGAQSEVINSRPRDIGGIRRRRRCASCGERFTTVETVDDDEGRFPLIQEAGNLLRNLSSEDRYHLMEVIRGFCAGRGG